MMSLRKIATYESHGLRAVVFRDAEWNEYRVKTYYTESGEWVTQERCDYHTDDKDDAISTALHIVQKGTKK
jgi:hypothetical protein